MCVNFTAADQATVAMTLPAVSVQEDEQSTMFCAELTLTSGYTLETVIIAPFGIDEDIATTGRAGDNNCVPNPIEAATNIASTITHHFSPCR